MRQWLKEGCRKPVLEVRARACVCGGSRRKDEEWVQTKLQALVYDILPSTTAAFRYAIGSRKLSANEQFFVGAQTRSKFVTNSSNKTRRVIYSRQ